MRALKTGRKAPAFSLEDQDGKTHTLEMYRGRTVILYSARQNTAGIHPKVFCKRGTVSVKRNDLARWRRALMRETRSGRRVFQEMLAFLNDLEGEEPRTLGGAA